MHREHTKKLAWARAVALGVVMAAGLATLIGSGGGFATFPNCDNANCYGPLPAPPPFVSLDPDHVTAQVGTAATFTVTDPVGASVAYRWQRWSDSQRLYVDIAGATAASYTLPAVNLGDDGAKFQVQVSVSNGIAGYGRAQLAVVSTPGLVIADTEFSAADWQALSPADVAGAPPTHTEGQQSSGGHPGAFRRMQSSQGQVVFHLSQGAGYEPQTQGAVYVIDYAEDARADVGAGTLSGFVLEQSGRRYTVLGRAIVSLPTQWAAQPVVGSVRANELVITDGPACGAGETCPNFSALGAPMRFGYWRQAHGSTPTTHDIDNWKVTVWRR